MVRAGKDGAIAVMGSPGWHPVAWGAAVLGTGILLLFSLAMWTNLTHQMDQRADRAALVSALIEGTVTRTLESVEVTLAAIGDGARAAIKGEAEMLTVRQRIADALRFAPHIRQIAVLKGSATLLDSRNGGEARDAIALDALGLPADTGAGLSLGLRIGHAVAGRWLPTQD
ncbi:MAG: hypothetical protein K2Q10_10220, partial [Rhodospirillales bacterium]|nr:hypothetical protein [Rhodospirillales bacterium]